MSVNGDANKVRVMLVDDRVILREGIHFVLEAEEDIEVVAEAATVEEARSYWESLSFDVVVIFSRMAPTLAEQFNGVRLVLVGTGAEQGPQELNGAKVPCLARDVAPEVLVQAVRGRTLSAYAVRDAKQALIDHPLSLTWGATPPTGREKETLMR